MADWRNLSKLIRLHDRISWLFSQENMDIINKLEGIDNTISAPVDIAENEDSIYIYMEVPGIDIHKVSVFYKDGEITIKGSKESKPLAENEKAIRIERYYGNFERTFSIKYPVNEHSIKASLTDGILTVTMDKISEKKNIDIQT